MNRRQLEGLICAGALDGLSPNRAELFANADMLLAVADAAMRERESGQVGLFGGEDAAQEDLRLQATDPWSRPEQMAKERENFGFYFSAHPVQQYRDVASAQGARTYQSLMDAGAPPGGRGTAMIAAMVESAGKGRTKRGAEFTRGQFSDSSGQFSAACFEEALVPQFQTWAESGECVLLTVELDSPNPGEPPRLTVRGARPLSSISGSTPMILKADVHTLDALAELQLELATGKDAPGEVLVRLILGPDDEAHMRLGSNFILDGDLAERLSGVEGIANVALEPQRGRAKLKLVA
jgi:DNA polymerase-3 subunit alpha